MTLTIGREEVECESFRVRGSYNSTIARLFALPVAVQSTEPLTLEVTIKGNKFKPVKKVRRVYWQKKYVGYFVIGNVSQEWEGDRYRTRLELKQCERSDVPQDEIPIYKWRHDLIALSQNLEQTDGAIIAAGRQINPIAESWKVGNTEIASASDDNVSPAVLPVSLGGTGASDPVIALINLGAISSASKGLPFGVAPLGSDGKVPAIFLPPGGGGGGGSVTFPITVAQGGTNALDAATARTNLGVVSTATYTAGLALKLDASARSAADGVAPLDVNSLVPTANLPAYPTLASLGAVSTSTYTDGLALKLDASARNAANGVAPLNVNSLVPTANLPAYPTLASLGAVSTSTYTDGLALKLDASARNAANGVAPLNVNSLVPTANLPAYPTLASLGAVSTSTYTAGLALKLDASARNAANGVAGIDANSLLTLSQIPNDIKFEKLPRSGAAAINFNNVTSLAASLRWIDGNAGHTNFPAAGSSGALFEYDPLNAVATALYKFQIFISYNDRVSERHQNNGAWGAWNERAYLNRTQTFTSSQEFSIGATFRAGSSPTITPSLTRAGVDANGLPRYWLVNASAPVNSRIKSITVANNGNVQIRHHNDDLSDGNVLEHTASGNVLTNGTLRCGGGSTNFTGATFVPGALFFRNDINMLVYSDGTNWRRMDTNATV